MTPAESPAAKAPNVEGSRPLGTDFASTLFDELTSPGRDREGRWARVQQLVTDAEAESLHLDFKSVEKWPTDEKGHAYVSEQLARSISGFANVAGGLLILGVSTKHGSKGEPDRAQRVEPITNIGAFRAWVEKRASLVAEPVVAGVDVREIPDPADPSRGALAVLIPESFGGPHRATRTSAETNERYFMRTTTEITTMPHALLADRFSRSPARSCASW